MKPKTPKAALAFIKKAAQKGKIIFAPAKVAATLDPWIERIMLGLGHKHWLISDQSCISDLRHIDETPLKFRHRLDKLSKKIGVPIAYTYKLVKGHYHSECDSVIAIARRLRDKEKAGIS